MKGGNTEEVYAKNQANFDNRKTFAESLKAQHPDVVQVVQKWGRWHHHVDYSGFTQPLQYKDGIYVPKGINDYGMETRMATPEELAHGESFFN